MAKYVTVKFGRLLIQRMGNDRKIEQDEYSTTLILRTLKTRMPSDRYTFLQDILTRILALLHTPLAFLGVCLSSVERSWFLPRISEARAVLGSLVFGPVSPKGPV